MRFDRMLPVGLLCVPLIAACGSSKDGGATTSGGGATTTAGAGGTSGGAGGAGGTGVGGTGVGGAGGGEEEQARIDTTAERELLGAHGGASVGALAALKGVLSGCIADDPTLDPAADAAANAKAIAARIKEQACAELVLDYTEGSVTVGADFGTGCALGDSGLTVAGKATFTVSKANGEIAVAITLTGLAADGYQLDGTAKVSTKDAKTYALTVDVTEASTGQLTFQGTAGETGSTPDTATVTIDGTGAFKDATPAEKNIGDDGWTCGTTATTVTATGLVRKLADCYPSGGTLSIKETYACTKEFKKGGKTFTLKAAASTTAAIEFNADTAMSGTAKASITGSIGDAGITPVKETIQLPAHGKCADGGT